MVLLDLMEDEGLIDYGVVCRLLIYHVKPMLICHLRGSYNTLWCCSRFQQVLFELGRSCLCRVGCTIYWHLMEHAFLTR